MNLQNFEQYIEEKILARGLDYYRSGCIVALEQDGGEWVADVEGSDDYTVTVTLGDGGEIGDSECDCPYDWGAHCKHQAAVFYALRSRLKPGKAEPASAKKKGLKELLGALDRETLLSIVLEFSDRDKRMKEELLLRYAEKEDMLQNARNVIKSAIAGVTRRGYIEYRDTRRAVAGADTVLQTAEDMMDSGETLTAVSLFIIVLEEMLELIGHCDDSSGIVGGMIYRAIEGIELAIDAAGSKDAETLFDSVFRHALNARYNGWTEKRMELLFALMPLCAVRACRDKLERYIAEQEDGSESDAMQRLQFDLIEHFDGETEAEAYMQQRLGNRDFRHRAIQNATIAKEYEKALHLCLEGEVQDSAHPGLVQTWRELRYGIYEKTEDRQAQRVLAKAFALDGDYAYFQKLKALYPKTEWEPVLQSLLEKLGERDRYGVYVKILVSEGLKPQLMDYCKKNPHCVVSYYAHLLPEYKEEVGTLIMAQIRKSAMHANTRSHYRDICGLLRHYQTACGRETVLALRDELMGMYPKRPAFLDELGKL
ncbi:MAG: hypothetical protein FWF10_08360 [Clostridiales bacterium]|nr:hypothetical protein [Clostridiales bacterium]